MKSYLKRICSYVIQSIDFVNAAVIILKASVDQLIPEQVEDIIYHSQTNSQELVPYSLAVTLLRAGPESPLAARLTGVGPSRW